MISRIYYEGKLKGPFGPLALLSLQKKCGRRNLDAGITSFLYYDKTRVFQVLEGEQKKIEATIQRISENKLMDSMKVRAIMRCKDRNFSHWPFGATHADDPDFKRTLNASQQADFFALDVLQAERILGIVASRKRRAMKVDEFSIKSRNFSKERPPRGLFASAARPQAKTGRFFVRKPKEAV